MPFQKGKSGNPGGRPKENAEIKQMARKHTKEALERLLFWMRDENPKASVMATMAILDRGWGKPAQEMQLSGEVDQPSFAVLANQLAKLSASKPIAAAAPANGAQANNAEENWERES